MNTRRMIRRLGGMSEGMLSNSLAVHDSRYDQHTPPGFPGGEVKSKPDEGGMSYEKGDVTTAVRDASNVPIRL